VVTKVGGPFNIQGKKEFSIIDISDLVKYDTEKIYNIIMLQNLRNHLLKDETEEESVKWLRM
jgi:hypothetical protein